MPHDDSAAMESHAETQPGTEEAVRVPVGEVMLDGDLARPPQAAGMVLFAHGSGSSRHSPRNRGVADHLRRAGFGTLLLDLFTAEEERLDLHSRELRFDIGLLARRLLGTVDWLAARFGDGLSVGLFGASTGAAGALVAAAERPDRVAAVVSRAADRTSPGRPWSV